MSMLSTEIDLATLLVKLRRRAQRLGSQPGDAEDMAQETVLRLIQRMERTTVETPEQYAMIILHNLARARWRTQLETTELEEDAASTLPVGDSRLAIDDLRRAIAVLPEEQAQVMELVLQGEHSPKEIAKKLGIRQGTVMSRLARARAKLRAHVGMDAGTPVAELL